MGRPPLAAKIDDFEIRGYLRHRGFLEYLADGMIEERYYRSLVVGAVDPATTFVDAGTDIGVYTLLTCDRARRVLSFEPDPYNLAALQRNVERRGCATVEIHAKAVAEGVPREVDVYRELDVDTISLDDVLDDSDVASLVVKLDVEGAEPLALEGMRHTIRRARRVVIFAEVNPEALEAGGSSAEWLVKDLLVAGMECAWIDEEQRAVVPLHEAGRLAKGNLMCVKGSTG